METNLVETKNQKSEMKVLGRKGDSRYEWDIQNPDEVEAARDIFDQRVSKDKWSAFRETKRGEKGERIKEFDPDAARIILVPPIQGGNF